MMSTNIAGIDQPHTKRVLKTASELGIKYYRMAWYKYDNSKSIAQNHADFEARMRDLAAMNEHYGIYASYQNHAGTSLGGPVWDVGMILHKLNTKWIGYQYDIRHATVEGGQAWPVGLRYVAPLINTLDIKDFQWINAGGKWKAKSTPLGEGMVDFVQFIELLKELNVVAPFSIHLEYDLGGANHGARKLTIPVNQVIDAMKKDLAFFKRKLNNI